MGHKLSLFESCNYQIAMLGLDNAGKSTIMYRLKMEQFVQQAPTVGFNCEKVPFFVFFQKNSNPYMKSGLCGGASMQTNLRLKILFIKDQI